MGRPKKAVAQARDQFWNEWLDLAEMTENQIEAFRNILMSKDIEVNKEFVDTYIDTATTVAELYRQVNHNLVKRNDKKAMKLAFEAAVYEDSILAKYEDFFNPLKREELIASLENGKS